MSKKLSQIEDELFLLQKQITIMTSDKVFPLSDSLQLDIEIYSDAANNIELKGSRVWILPILKNDFKFKLKIEASTVNEYFSAILLHVNKNFCIYATFSTDINSEGVVTLYYLDIKGKSINNLKLDIDDVDLNKALGVLTPYIKVIFYKKTNDIKWIQLNHQE